MNSSTGGNSLIENVATHYVFAAQCKVAAAADTAAALLALLQAKGCQIAVPQLLHQQLSVLKLKNNSLSMQSALGHYLASDKSFLAHNKNAKQKQIVIAFLQVY